MENMWPRSSIHAHGRHHKLIRALFLWSADVSLDTFPTKRRRYPQPVDKTGFQVKTLRLSWGLRLPVWNEWEVVLKCGYTGGWKKTGFPSSAYPGITIGNHKLESGWELPFQSGVRKMNILSLSQTRQLSRCPYISLQSPKVTLLLWIEPKT